MTERWQVKFLKIQEVDPPLGVHRIVPALSYESPFNVNSGKPCL